MTAKIQFDVKAEDICKEQAGIISKAEKAIKAAQQRLLTVYKETPRYAALRDFCKLNQYGQKGAPFVAWNGGTLTVHVYAQEAPNAVASKSHIDPKTTNLLLSGNLLSVEEKRQLLKHLGLDFALSKDTTQ